MKARSNLRSVEITGLSRSFLMAHAYPSFASSAVFFSQVLMVKSIWFINVNKLSSFSVLAVALMVSLPDAADVAVPDAAGAADAPVASPIAKAWKTEPYFRI